MWPYSDLNVCQDEEGKMTEEKFHKFDHKDWDEVRLLTKDEDRKELAQKQFRNPQPAVFNIKGR